MWYLISELLISRPTKKNLSDSTIVFFKLSNKNEIKFQLLLVISEKKT
jgi:hypothetical protein